MPTFQNSNTRLVLSTDEALAARRPLIAWVSHPEVGGSFSKPGDRCGSNAVKREGHGCSKTDGVLDIGLELNEVDLACSVFGLEVTHDCFLSGRSRGRCGEMTPSN